MIFPKSMRDSAAKNLKQQLDHLKAATGINSLHLIARQIDGLGENRLYKIREQPELMTYGEQYLLAVFFKKSGLTFDPTLGGVI